MQQTSCYRAGGETGVLDHRSSGRGVGLSLAHLLPCEEQLSG